MKRRGEVEIREPEPLQDMVHEASLKGMGRAINIIREQRQMSREKVALKCEMTVHELEAIEGGKLHARWGDLRKIAEALDTPLSMLFVEAEKHAPGPGGKEWRRRAEEASGTRSDSTKGRQA
jgi:transcriptional regulator with XRE-family HTH domain